MSPKPKHTEFNISPEVQRDTIETPFKQDLLEYYERQSELYERFPVGKQRYNVLTVINADEPAARAMRGSDSDRFALTQRGRTHEDIRRAAERQTGNIGNLALRFSDIAAAPTMKAVYRTQIDSLDITEEEKIGKFDDAERQIDRYVGQQMLGEFKQKFLTSPQATQNRRKAEANLKKGIKLQREMRAKQKTAKLGVERPTFFDDIHSN